MHQPASRLTAGPAAESPDAVLSRAIRSRLESTGYHQLRRIDVAVSDGHVRLSGRVARYYLLQLAQNAAMTTAGVHGIASEIEVVRE